MASPVRRGTVPIGYFAALYRFFRDPNASKIGKLFVVLTLAYIVWPLDFVPDVAPILGWLDDAGLATVALAYLARVAARYRSESLQQLSPASSAPAPGTSAPGTLSP
ncbi:DUF1232 domain-containing protein [Pendulispora brunnea]|uniref:DUF1232 domain-containing protein n=1 Tax=Pendulispora brunnea TaxID=2905690 RepID=A0ABZ2KEL6_9BACT